MTYSQIPPMGNALASKHRLQYCAAKNLLKHAIATEFGGLGDNFQALVAAHFALGKSCQDTGLVLSINAHLWGAVFPVLRYGCAEQQTTWLPALLAGDIIAGHAITEPQAGSDLNALTTHAGKTQTGFVLNGQKRFITNTPIADMMIVYAKLDHKLSAFIVRADDLGANFTDASQVDGCASATMGDIILQDCQLPHNRLLGKAGAGNMMIQSALELERAFIFAGINGIMHWQLQQIIQYSRKRRVENTHLGHKQAISHKIADMKLRLDSSLLWVNECARLKDNNKRISLASAQTKLFAADAFLQSSLDAVHIMGASGLMATQKMAVLVQDAMASRLFSGSSEIQKNMIAALLGTGSGYKSKS